MHTTCFTGNSDVPVCHSTRTQCTTAHESTSQPPKNLKTAMDYFLQGNYDYDTGDCTQAIVDYTKSISLNSDYPEAHNNSAYTYMQMQDYRNALTDLNKSLQLNPNYIQALMNRGDIHTYYYSIDRQAGIADYKKVMYLGEQIAQVFADIFSWPNIMDGICGHFLDCLLVKLIHTVKFKEFDFLAQMYKDF